MEICAAYITHKHLAAGKIMEAMRNSARRKRARYQHASNYTNEENDHGRHARAMCEESESFAKNFSISLNRLMNPVVKVLLKCVIRFSISLPCFAFSVCKFLEGPLAYGVRISSKTSATAVCVTLCELFSPKLIKPIFGNFLIQIGFYCRMLQPCLTENSRGSTCVRCPHLLKN